MSLKMLSVTYSKPRTVPKANPVKMCVSGGGLLMAPIDAPQVIKVII